MNNLKNLLSELESKITHIEKLDGQISNASVGWHLEHSLLTIKVITDRLQQTKSENYKSRFNFPRWLVFTLGKIPRGKGKAPKLVVPGSYNADSIKIHIEKVSDKLGDFDQMKPDQYFEHPYFGHLRVKETIRFLEIHTQHHLNIIDDIITSKK